MGVSAGIFGLQGFAFPELLSGALGALTLTASDNANGSGLTATIAGSDAASDVAVWASPVVLGTNPLVWTSVGTRSGDGVVAVARTGYQWLYATGLVSGGPALSPPIMGLGSLAATAVYTQCRLAIQARIQSLTLASITTLPAALTAGDVYVFPELDKVFFSLITSFPCVLVTPPPRGAETVGGGTNLREDIGHPVLVSIVDRVSPLDAAARAPTYELWREQILAALRFGKLAGSSLVFIVKPEPGPIAQWEKPNYQLFYSYLTFRCFARQARV